MAQDMTRDCDEKCRYYPLRHPRNVGTTSRGHREAQSLIEQSAQTVVGLALGANSWETSMGRVREQSGCFFFLRRTKKLLCVSLVITLLFIYGGCVSMADNVCVCSNNVTLSVTGIIRCGEELSRCVHWCSVDSMLRERSRPCCGEVHYH